MIRQRLTIALVLAVLGLVAACGGEEQAAPTSTPKPEARPAPSSMATAIRVVHRALERMRSGGLPERETDGLDCDTGPL